MMKYLKYSLIGCTIILALLLGINIYKYISYQNNNKQVIESTDNYDKQIIENNKKKETLNTELTDLKKEKEDKIWEYERWIKWNEEMLKKIN